jgi:putative redox protein
MPGLTSTVTLQTEMHFAAELDGHDFAIDADPQVGGQDLGPRPKGLMLTALAGCTAMDVVSILRKMRVTPTAFNVEANAQVTDEHPRVFSHIHLTYRFQGDVPRDKAQKAIELSQERYCGVSAMLKQVVPIDWEIVIEP